MGPAGDEHTVDSWTEKDQSIVVSQPEGFMFDLLLRARIDSAPEDVYAVLTDPDAISIFKNLKEVTYRNVIHDDGRGRRHLEVGHRAIAKFLFLKVTFDTHLRVWEDDNTMTIRFENARDSFMRKFDGSWRVQPFTQDTLDAVFNQHHHKQQQHHHHKQQQHQHQPLWHGTLDALAAIQQRLQLAPQVNKSLVTLEQAVMPKALPPKAIQSMVRALCARQVQSMMEDLRRETERRTELRRQGRPVPRHQELQRLRQQSRGVFGAGGLGGPFGGPGRPTAAPAASLSGCLLQLDVFKDWGSPLELHLVL